VRIFELVLVDFSDFISENCWARSYYVSTVGLDEATVIEYIRNQEAEEDRHEQMKLRMPL
jgi:putative transposase